MDRVNRIVQHDVFRTHLEQITRDERERPFCGHGFGHLMDVARIAYIYSLEENWPAGVDVPSKELIYAAALLHDIGRHLQYASGVPHQEAGAALAEDILKDCGFLPGEMETVCTAIREHRENGESRLGRLLYRADKASRLCFRCEAGGACNWPEEKKNLKVGV